MASKERQCPACRRGIVRIAELRSGAECSHCRSTISVDMFYAWCTTILLFVGFLILLPFDQLGMTMALVAASVIYSIWGFQINERWLPLKCYEE